MISNVKNVLVISPPTIGAAIRFITSDPVPSAHSNGVMPMMFTATVIRLAFDVAHGSNGGTRAQLSSGLLF